MQISLKYSVETTYFHYIITWFFKLKEGTIVVLFSPTKAICLTASFYNVCQEWPILRCRIYSPIGSDCVMIVGKKTFTIKLIS